MNRWLIARDDREFPHSSRCLLRERQLARRGRRASADGRARGDRRDGAVLRSVAPADGLGLALEPDTLDVRDLDLIEINEAFAGVVLASTRDLGLAPD